MPSFSKSCDIKQGFDYKKDVVTNVGFITKLKVGDNELTADITCKDPMNPKTDLPVVSVMSDFAWETGVTDTLHMAGQLSAANRQVVALLAYLDLSKVDVLFKVDVYEYDPVAKTYFKCLAASSADMKGLLEKNGSDLNISVADDPSHAVQSPINYAFSIGIKPQPEAQSVTVATANQKNVVKAWGIKVS